MLQAIRRGTSSWIVKILLGMMVLAFALFFGFGDFAGVQFDTTVLSVGGRDISASEFQREVSRLQARLRPEVAQQVDIGDLAIRGLVNRTLIDLEVGRLGLAVSDAVVKEQIYATPAFQNTLGRFDAAIFEQALLNIGMNEQMYVAAAREDTVRDQIVSSLVGGGGVPSVLKESIFKYRGERRIAEVLVIPNASFTGIGVPDEAALSEFHRTHAGRYTDPEYRSLTFITLTPEDLVAEIAVSDEDLREEYDARLDDYVTEERRDVEQIVFSDEKSARAAYALLQGGKDFATVAMETLKMSAEDTVLGLVTRIDLPGELSDAVFALPAGGNAAPVKTPFGWHLVHVKKIEPGGTRVFAEVREELVAEMKLERATDSLFEVANKVEDELAGGAKLEESAVRLGLKPQTIEAIDATGRDKGGKPVPDLLAPREFLGAAFETDAGAETPLTEVDEGGYFILRVDRVTPPALRSLNDVRDKVRSDWEANARGEAARRKGDELAQEVKGGADLGALAKEHGYRLRTTAALARDAFNADPALSPTALVALFGLAAGEVTTETTAAGDGRVVARLKQIKAADPAANASDVKRLEDNLLETISDDLLEQYRAALTSEHAVSIDRRAIEAFFDLTPGAGAS